MQPKFIAKSMSAWPNKQKKDPRNPGEPLYNCAELLPRIGISNADFRGYCAAYGALQPWMSYTTNNAVENGRNRYRLSDAKKWLANIRKLQQEKSNGQQHLQGDAPPSS